jgi:hypothetical protein
VHHARRTPERKEPAVAHSIHYRLRPSRQTMDGVGEAARWREGCPGCRQERRVQASDRIPYREFLYIWIACLCASMIYLSVCVISSTHRKNDACMGSGREVRGSCLRRRRRRRRRSAAPRRPEAEKQRPRGALTGARRPKGGLGRSVDGLAQLWAC